MLMKNFLYLTRVMAKDTEMTMPDTGEKAKAYKTLGSLAMFCIMVPCCLVVGFIVYIMTEALIEAGGMTEGVELIIQLMSVFGMIFSVMVLFNVLFCRLLHSCRIQAGICTDGISRSSDASDPSTCILRNFCLTLYGVFKPDKTVSECGCHDRTGNRYFPRTLFIIVYSDGQHQY